MHAHIKIPLISLLIFILILLPTPSLATGPGAGIYGLLRFFVLLVILVVIANIVKMFTFLLIKPNIIKIISFENFLIILASEIGVIPLSFFILLDIRTCLNKLSIDLSDNSMFIFLVILIWSGALVPNFIFFIEKWQRINPYISKTKKVSYGFLLALISPLLIFIYHKAIGLRL